MAPAKVNTFEYLDALVPTLLLCIVTTYIFSQDPPRQEQLMIPGGVSATDYKFSILTIMRAVIVTGCARGIGRAIALQLAKDGYHMALNDLPSNIRLLNDLQRDLADHNPEIKSIITPGDVTREPEVQRMVDETVHNLGSLDVVRISSCLV